MIADQSDGTETDRAGRVIVEPDLTVKGHPNVFVIGDLMSVPGVPGMAQGAIQGAHYATTLIKQGLKGHDDPANRKPFKYFDKGSMALVSRYSAVAKVGKLEFGGFIAWLAWLLLHLLYLVGFRNRIAAMFSWGISFLGRTRGQMAITSQMVYARVVTSMMQAQVQEGALAAVERAEAAEQKAAG
jgi:NADH dehydrogenase